MRTRLAYALRSLRRSRGFTVTSMVTLALGIGLTTAAFSVIHGVILRDLPFRDPGRLTLIRPDGRVPVFSKAEFEFVRETATSFTAVGARGGGRGAVLVGQGDPRAVTTSTLSSNLLALLGVAPVVGRGFDPGDAAAHAVAISERLWRTAFNADPTVIGRTIDLDERAGRVSHTVVGVLPPAMQLLHSEPVDLWFPLDLTAEPLARSASLQLIGRLGEGIDLAGAQADVGAVLSRWSERRGTSASGSRRGTVVGLHDWVLGNRPRMLWLLFAAAGFVLLIACANVANLFLVRSIRRREEFALRRALGADLRSIMGLLLSESAVIAVVGGAAGVALAYGALDLLVSGIPGDLPRREGIAVNGAVLATSLGVSGLAALVFALVPVLRLRRIPVDDVISHAGGRGGAAPKSQRLLRTIIAAEVALALLLTVGAGLMIRTLQALRAQDSGVEATSVVAITLQAQYPEPDRLQTFFTQLLERAAAVPGVVASGLTYHVPLSGSNSITTVRVPGHESITDEDGQTVGFQIVSSGYFSAMGIPLVRGETFSPHPETEVVVNETFARRYWPDQDPLGRVVEGADRRTVVGVVGDTRHVGLRLPPRPEVYYPVGAFPRGDMSLVVRSAIGAPAVAAAVRTEIVGLDPNVPITDVRLMNEVIDASLAGERYTLKLLGLFAVLALVLGAIGVYGVTAFAVSQQRRALGIRLALGASPRRVMQAVTAWGMTHVAAGLGAGALIAVALARVMKSLLFGVAPTDGTALVGAAVTLLMVAAGATLAPALSAAQIEPSEVLREE